MSQKAGRLILLCSHADVLIGGDDFKSGQTKMKSVLVDFLVGAGIKPMSIVSYNHLGNNDGMNLSAPPDLPLQGDQQKQCGECPGYLDMY